ncbi:MAG: TerB family tellurite resistance protein [Spirochaetota bacterium]|nr:MAG: TerB family tellurite resistance protein [Spirochaetota bacterium]
MKRYEGKLFGAALGFTFGGPIGAIIGAAAGHLFDTTRQDSVPSYSRDTEKELAFITSLILLLTGTAKADGRVTESEKNTIKDFFKHQLGYGELEYRFIERIIDKSFQKSFNLEEACNAINNRASYEERLFLIRLNYQVAVSDGELNQREEIFIEQASRYLGIESYDYTMIKNQFKASPGSAASGTGSARSPDMEMKTLDPYAVLGLEPNCSNDEIGKAYRNLANKYHPDKVSHLGREFIDLATRKFTYIQKAYDEIKLQRGIR